jgi:hypothetical protein
MNNITICTALETFTGRKSFMRSAMEWKRTFISERRFSFIVYVYRMHVYKEKEEETSSKLHDSKFPLKRKIKPSKGKKAKQPAKRASIHEPKRDQKKTWSHA